MIDIRITNNVQLTNIWLFLFHLRKISVTSAGLIGEIWIDDLLDIMWKGLELPRDAQFLKNMAGSQTQQLKSPGWYVFHVSENRAGDCLAMKYNPLHFEILHKSLIISF
jgi:hypothetical protein